MSLHRFWLIPTLFCLFVFAIDASDASAEQATDPFNTGTHPDNPLTRRVLVNRM
jgi:hypothetical protein